MSAANALVGDYIELNDEMVSYSNSLTATSVVLEAINAFLSALASNPNLSHFANEFDAFADRQFVQKIVSYVLSFRSTTSYKLNCIFPPQNR